MELLCEKVWAIGLLFIGLLNGVSGIAAECDVSVPCACCLDGLCHDGTSVCESGFCKDGYWGGGCTHSCPQECISCHRNFGFERQCFECVPGYYGHDCSSNCSSGCEVCNKDTGNCAECSDGYYGTTCDKRCSLQCKNITCHKDTGKCIECEVGYYGEEACNMTCEQNCKKNTCHIQSGICSACKDGFYGSYCNTSCSQNCTDEICNQSTGHCVTCELGYFGVFCNDVCPTYCVWSACIKESGHCYSCENGYYGANCSKKCPSMCYNKTCSQGKGVCTSGCTQGFKGDKCDECIDGKYGDLCAKNCSVNCLNSDCYGINGSCKFGCVPEYSDMTFCCANNRHCEKCSSYTDCTSCINGTYGTYCELKCSDNCVGGCDKRTGHSGVCDSCKGNTHGDFCQHDCPTSCLQSIDTVAFCYRVNGSCMFGCKPTFFGSTCESKCSESCNDTCDGQTGQCFGCLMNKYGSQCENICSDGCVQGIIGTHTCSQTNGFCSLGCLEGFSGMTCSRDSDGATTLTVTILAVVAAMLVMLVILATYIVKIVVRKRKSGKRNTEWPPCIPCTSVSDVPQKSQEKLKSELQGCSPNQTLTKCTETTSEFEGVKPVVMSTQLDKETGVKGADDEEEIYSKRTEQVAVSTKLVEKTEFNGINEDEENDLKGEEMVTMSTQPGGETGFKGSGVEEEELKDGEPAAMSKRLDEGVGFNGGDVEEEELEEGEPIACTTNLDEETNPYYSNARRLNTRIPKINVRQILDKSDERYKEEFQLYLPNGLTKPTTEAQKLNNASKNRYKRVYPYDDSRVKIEDTESDYINACYIDGFRTKRAYIAAQGPTIKQLGKDFKAFWQMVWQEKVETIVMVTELQETSGMKCDKYWPDFESSSNYAEFSVDCVKEEQFAELTVRSLNISKNEEKRCINHVNFTAWPDKAVPDDVTSLIGLRYKVVNMKKMLEEDGPLLVHCSAGIGRTGTYIALDILTDQGSTEDYVDVFNCVFNMRNQRVHMVQTLEQYKFLHHAVLWTLTSDIEPLPADRFMDLSWLSNPKLNDMMETIRRDLMDALRKKRRDLYNNIENMIFHQDNAPSHTAGHKHTVTLLVNERSTAAQYINAVFLDGYKKQNQFIVAMTPLPETVTQFLSMIIQNDVTCIVDITPQDCKHDNIGKYLPADKQNVEWGQHVFEISHPEDHGCFTKTEITLSDTTKPADQECRTIHHYSFTKWNASATLPDSADDFVKLVNEIGVTPTDTKAARPIAVHCPSGAERSGLFCAVWLLIERMKIDREVSVLNTLRQVKTRRRMAISSSEQIRFCFKCAASYMNNMHDPVYSNTQIRL